MTTVLRRISPALALVEQSEKLDYDIYFKPSYEVFFTSRALATRKWR